MEYFLKASAVMTIFYGCYIIFLQRETFYDANRWFLLLGLLTAVIFPLMVIPIYIEVSTTPTTVFAATTTTTPPSSQTLDLTTLLLWGYVLGLSFFLGRFIVQLSSIVSLIKKHHRTKGDGYTILETTQNPAPFSFFKWIIYNPTQFDAQERQLILEHEKVHAFQNHSVDVLIMDLATVVFWCNPFVWLYKTALKQNLEFIADHHTQKRTCCDERYQKLLLKTSIPAAQYISINPFYNSTIKKRILMLHKTKSSLMNTWKYSTIIPILALFATTFNTETIAQTTSDTNVSTPNDQQNILKFILTKDTKKEQLDMIKDKLNHKGASITFESVERNSKNEITGIHIAYKYKGKLVTHLKNSFKPITSIEISMNPSNDSISIGDQTSDLSQTIEIKNDGSAQIAGFETDSKNEPILTLVNKFKSNSVSKDSVFISNTTDKVHNRNSNQRKDVIIKNNDNEVSKYNYQKNKPLILLNDKELTDQQMNAIDPNTIASINVLKDESDTKKYGEKGKNGVIIIHLKEDLDTHAQPLYILDGEEIDKSVMEAISPDSIESVEVLKNDAAIKKYGAKGKNGVIIITTKP